MQEDLYGSTYELDSDGRVWSNRSQQWLTPSTNKSGFSFYTIYLANGKQKAILPHIEVWRLFRGEIPHGGIEHIDGNKNNNSLQNLRAKCDGNKFLELVKQGISITKIARYYKVPKKTISVYISDLHPGGIRELRKRYPLNKSQDIR